MNSTTTRAAVRQANDILRTGLVAGNLFANPAFARLGEEQRQAVFRAVSSRAAVAHDQGGEHAAGVVAAGGVLVLWCILYCAPDLRDFSRDPADPAATRRLLVLHACAG